MHLFLVFLVFFLLKLSMAQADNIDIFSEQEDLSLFFDADELYVKSASRIKETISEAPAVVNIITARQIRTLGARNLMDVLVTIPGFTEIQDTNEKVVAGRGVFATTTHKFLLLRDGHRLNEPMFEEIMPANAISLTSIKRIEVLRGPGASLYGNAAFLGVINIITLDANAPSQASVVMGNFGEIGADFVINEKFNQDRQLLLFASVRHASGEIVNLPANQDMAANPVAGSQKIASRPFNFDVGMKYKRKTSLIAFSARRAAYNTPRSNNGALLTHADTLVKPIQVFETQHLDVQLLPQWHDIHFTLRHYADRSFLRTPQYVQTARDARPLGKAFDLRIESARAGIEYSAVIAHDGGELILGTQLENFWLLNSSIKTSFANNSTMVAFPNLAQVSEWNGALYAQEKYHITPHLIVNAGIRWDYYQSFGHALNPRLALVYNPFDELYMKAIYGRAFQAPSYFYRTKNKGLGYGSPTGLTPEKLENVQISVENTFLNKTWLRMTMFHNRIKNLITRPVGATSYQNIGGLITQGIETEIKIKVTKSMEIFANHALTIPVSSGTDAKLMALGKLANIPRDAVTAGVTWKSASALSGSVYMNWHSNIASPIVGATAAQSNPSNAIPAAALVNMTLNADDVLDGMQAQLSLHNLLNKRDWRGGTTRIPYPQLGRNILLTLGYRL
ncbi:MAG: TonB-dependent receptor [Mariprofundaceae bacterium]|nr:TonB-dependent receptor [Mariprofundaceae bacterium]